MLPLAPARFSTTTCWPSTVGSAFATRRVMLSAAPPGELGTMQRMGFDGKVGLEAAWPQPGAAGVHARAVVAMSFSSSGRLFIFLLLSPFRYFAAGGAAVPPAG